MVVAQGSVRDVENYLSPSEAGEVLGTSGQWVKQLARRGELDAVETHLGWLIEPGSVERLVDRRVQKAEGRVASLKSVQSRTKKKLASSSVRGRAAHGKSLRSKRSGL
jgi:hypothetical protein